MAPSRLRKPSHFLKVISIHFFSFSRDKRFFFGYFSVPYYLEKMIFLIFNIFKYLSTLLRSINIDNSVGFSLTKSVEKN